jgi:PAS domain S-box-containing protein
MKKHPPEIEPWRGGIRSRAYNPASAPVASSNWSMQDTTTLETALEQERALLDSVMSITDVMLVYLDRNFDFVWVNQAYADTCKMARDEMIGKNHFALYPHAENEAIFRRVRDSGQPVFHKDRPFEFPDQPERGVTYWDWSLAPDKNKSGQVVGLVFSLRETTSHVRARQAVRESEERFAAMADAAPVLIWMAGPDKRCTWFNKQWLDFTGCTMAQEFGNGWIDGVHPDDFGRCVEVFESSFDRREPFRVDYRRRTAGGDYRWITDGAVPRHSADGAFLGYIGACADITERKRAEDALRAAKAEAERANDAKSRFLAAVSHDLRQPLSALSLYVGTLGAKLSPADDRLLMNMKDCVASLSEMLSNLLDLSRLEAGAVRPSVCDFPLGQVFTKVASAHAPEATIKRLSLRFGYFDAIAHTDPVLFERIVGNLVSNAIRYTDRGGVLIGCRRRQGKRWVEVWDTGIGIPADKTTEIFEEFKQLGNYERNRAKGTGLGLTIAAKTAALLGLEVRVRSRPGKGSMFAVELPLGKNAEPVPQRQYAHRPLRIALVEDNADVAQALAYSLAERGHHVVAAPSRAELAPLLGNSPPDIVMSDYRLAGGETGLDVIAAVRADFGAHLPAIVITGDTDPRLIRSMAEKDIRLLHKPLDIDVLCAAIAELTRLHPTSRMPNIGEGG